MEVSSIYTVIQIPDRRYLIFCRRHAFSDLRPYVCIVDDCDVDHMNFTSRAEFAAHLTQHQRPMLWTCSRCGHAEEKKDLIHDHINSKHVTDRKEDRNFYIIQKPIFRDLSSQICPFCGKVPGAVKFVGHLCNHLEEISLSAIPRDDEEDEDVEENSLSRASLLSKIEDIRASESVEEVEVDNMDSSSYGGSGGASFVGTSTYDGISDGFSDTGRGNDLAFADRIY
jgi:hypothetical protein